MPGPQVTELTIRIRHALHSVSTVDEAIDVVRQGVDVLQPRLSESLVEEFNEARELIEREIKGIEILHRHTVVKSKPDWYKGPLPTDLHWPAVREYLSREKGWAETDIEAIDETSNEIVSMLGNPKERQFSYRGLVVGHVQSGKTASMCAVAAKALDAGYDTVIVLAGLTNKLRYQTQLRLDEDLVSRYPENWQVLTPNRLNQDFRAPPHGGFLSHVDKKQLAVVKKNVSPLGELKAAVESTLPNVVKRLKILVIDDECDQASINSARHELDMTAINHRIRELLSILPAVTYVGYTATPFANVLINPYLHDGQELDDLYPRDFITALPPSPSYFGTERLFGLPPADPDDIQPEEEGLDMIREVPIQDEALLQPRSRNERDSFQPVMTSSLENAILYFIASCAARHARGDGDKHMTMLVHTSAFVVVHKRMASLIEGWVNLNRKKLLDKNSAKGQRIRKIWEEEQARVSAGMTNADLVEADQLFEYIPSVLKAMEFPVENGASDDRIDYAGDPKTYIAVGGSILARGLTLEGLTVSYFLRTTNQYDTLLQMGRWFGYRPGYEDLPRIWLPAQLGLRFRALAGVEQEIRDDIEQYRLQNLTPLDIAVKIRAIPGMAITGANRMRAARRCSVSYWGTHRQTFRFSHHDEDFLRTNWNAGVELISEADALGLRDANAYSDDRKLWRNVPRSSINRFFVTYRVHETHADLTHEMLLPFLEQEDARLDSWNVGIVEARQGPESLETLGPAQRLNTVNRAKLVDGNSFADIKALMSKRDVLFDCNENATTEDRWDDLKETRVQSVGQVPLLLLYPIDRHSTPQRESAVRTGLDAVFDILGYGIVFPGSVTEGGDFVSIELNPLSADEIDEIAADEMEQASAAGVN